MKKILTLAVLSLALVGCGPNKYEAAAINSESLSAPIKVGNLPDGREVRRVKLAIENSEHSHYIYYIDRADVTTNQSVQNGKTRRIQTNSLFDEQ